MTEVAVRSERIDYLTSERPALRGWLHKWSFFAAIPAGVALIMAARGAEGKAAASIYFASLLTVFGTSAAYHRLAQSYRARTVMQRLDHSMIYVLIAGSYVPICLIALPPAWGIPLLAAVGAMGLFGMVIKLAGIQRLNTVGYVLYPVMGWAAVVTFPALRNNLTGAQMVLIAAGGISYTVGFPVLLLRRPDPWPKIFGYHEVWHGFTVVAAALHFGAVVLLVT